MKRISPTVFSCLFILSLPLQAVAQMAPSASVDVERPSAPEDRQSDVRTSIRGAYDRNWELGRSMNALGIDVAVTQRHTSWEHFRLEAGGTASAMGDNEDTMAGANGHVTLFPALDFNGFVFGPRGLAGVSWDTDTNQTRPDFGGEGRLGIQAETYSFYLSAGRTLELTRMAMDFGARF
jgi:hypothetical protein